MAISSTQLQSARDADSNAHKYLTFCLGSEHYGIGILRVREIIGLIAITPLPRTPDFVKGVMNLRGRIIPVIDLRRRFSLPDAETTKETCVIVVDASGGEGEQLLTGVVVDSVREVQDIPPDAIEAAPEFGCSVPLDYIQGLGKTKEKVVVLLDVGEVLDARAAIPADVLDHEMRRAA
ncbi:MAG: chemotaxis protein CheW [Phycisphaerae bacterium]|nr:chemotaxis protein CheW [Phycisphaerae bacterium]